MEWWKSAPHAKPTHRTPHFAVCSIILKYQNQKRVIEWHPQGPRPVRVGSWILGFPEVR